MLLFRTRVYEVAIPLSLLRYEYMACNPWQNAWESDFWRPRHPRALDDQQLLAIEGSQNPLKAGTPLHQEENSEPPNTAMTLSMSWSEAPAERSLHGHRNVSHHPCTCGLSTSFCTVCTPFAMKVLELVAACPQRRPPKKSTDLNCLLQSAHGLHNRKIQLCQ